VTALSVGSPVAGRVVALTDVPDPVFAEAMVGPGLAVVPSGDIAVAPVAGTIATLHPHAFVVATDSGRAVLVHLGIDTVQLKGSGFTLHVAKGDVVTAGQPIIGWDPVSISASSGTRTCRVRLRWGNGCSTGVDLRPVCSLLGWGWSGLARDGSAVVWLGLISGRSACSAGVDSVRCATDRRLFGLGWSPVGSPCCSTGWRSSLGSCAG
jgi:PTS system N-acetylglucosamine-specific IIA component